ncbi:TD and POZ domain-containing protein 3 [Nephila pilipes]|uniref:TD and POZ domain-containing protein 3 n=1 Tax=Nephila pilipes TaxID=299642 RepID=A0A8X6P068_NEPPI|nr:TD and POZ domain-containing protein 3 [Nephila pilipes]
MASVVDSKKALFTYIWVIENFSIHSNGTIKSPSFTVNCLNKTKWSLTMWNTLIGDYCSVIRLVREENDGGPDSIGINFELSVLNENGSPLIKKQNICSFEMGRYFHYADFIETQIYQKRSSEFLPKGCLTIRCQLWREDENNTSADLCFARSIVGLDRRCFTWSIKNFSSLEIGQKRYLLLEPAFKGGASPILSITLIKFRNEEMLLISIESGEGTKDYVVRCEISIINIEGKVGNTLENVFFLNFTSKRALNANPLSKKWLIENNYLMNDVLTLRFSLEIDIGIVSSRIEDYRQFSISNVDEVVPSLYNMFSDKPSAECCFFKKAIKNMYEKRILSDICLRSDSESFHVHKNILGVRSPVFEAMFRNDMKEKMKTSIDLHDIDANTLHRLLLYIYTDTVEDLEWETALDLYRAADRYGVIDLREKCSMFFKANFSQSNVFHIFSLADMHHDQDLKIISRDFITRKSAEFINSEEWKTFKKSNIELAFEIMEYMCSKKGQQ